MLKRKTRWFLSITDQFKGPTEKSKFLNSGMKGLSQALKILMWQLTIKVNYMSHTIKCNCFKWAELRRATESKSQLWLMKDITEISNCSILLVINWIHWSHLVILTPIKLVNIQCLLSRLANLGKIQAMALRIWLAEWLAREYLNQRRKFNN